MRNNHNGPKCVKNHGNDSIEFIFLIAQLDKDQLIIQNFFTIKAALADRKKVVKTGSISMGRGRCMGRGSAGASCRGMGRGSARVRLRGMGRSSVGAKLRGMGKDSKGASLRGMGRGSAGVRLWGMGRGSAGTRMRGMGRGNDAKTALRVIKETKEKIKKNCEIF